ncbi:MAG: PH domain-containing protein [Thermoleophilaceae bacterium]|nr:PH domain-containing protein [Thermoleophilaceae bacterium]
MSSDLSFPRRLHPAEIALAALDSLRELLVAAVIGVLVGGGSGRMSPLLGLVVGLGGVGVTVAAGYVRWMNTTYRVSGDALHFRRGVLSPDETTIPIARIQAIDATQGPIQRLFGVHELHVQTAGGGSGGEIVLRAVSDLAGRELREVAGLPEPTHVDLPEWRLGAGGLLVTALTAPQIGVIVPVIAGLTAAGDDLLFGRSGERLLDRLPTDPGGIALVAAALAGAAFVLSFIGAIVAFGGFVLVRDGERLRIRRGVLQRRAASIPLGRVHAVDIVEGVLRRPFGLASIRMETAGYRSEPAVAQVLVPLLRVGDAGKVLREFVPGLALEPRALQRPPGRARRRYVQLPVLAGAIVGAAVTAVWPAAWPVIPALAILGAAEGVLRWRAAGWRLDGARIVIRQRLLARRTLVARADRLQEHGLSVSPLQRRGRLASFQVAVGSGRRGRVRHLDRNIARELFERLRPTRVHA